jgi:predicted RNA methylase
MTSKQKIGLSRDTIDKYYTKETIVQLCLNFVEKSINIDRQNDLVIEPSAGNGSFIKEIKKLCDNFVFYDIEPEHDQIIEQDYLKINYKELEKNYDNIHIIGNPPFGRQSSLAIKFIKKSCEFCKTFSFILPKSFKKDSLKTKIPLKFHLIFEIDLPDKSFLVNKNEYDVPCVFQIWEKKTIDRIVKEKLVPINFEFVKREENPDISFRRVGVNAGFITNSLIDEKSIQSHYFIRFTNKRKKRNMNEKIKLLGEIVYDFNNTVGPKSISKQELIAKFNPILS